METTANQALNPQVIGQTESALGALLGPVLAEARTSFEQWVVLAVTADGSPVDHAQLVARVVDARKFAADDVADAIAELAAANALTVEAGKVALTTAGQDLRRRIRTRIQEVTSGLFDFPAEDLATAGRVLATITARANAFLAGHGVR
jgi:chromosome segregation and condensation protein ScpB